MATLSQPQHRMMTRSKAFTLATSWLQSCHWRLSTTVFQAATVGLPHFWQGGAVEIIGRSQTAQVPSSCRADPFPCAEGTSRSPERSHRVPAQPSDLPRPCPIIHHRHSAVRPSNHKPNLSRAQASGPLGITKHMFPQRQQGDGGLIGSPGDFTTRIALPRMAAHRLLAGQDLVWRAEAVDYVLSFHALNVAHRALSATRCMTSERRGGS